MKSQIAALIFCLSLSNFTEIKAQANHSFTNPGFVKNSVRDSTKNTKIKTKSPRSAMIRSLVFPGLGQIYNEQYIKAGIVLAGQSVLIGLRFYYNNKANESIDPMDREFYKDRRNLTYWLMGATVLLSMLDAYIDAHLYDFDTGPELALRTGVLRSESVVSRGPNLGFSLRVKF